MNPPDDLRVFGAWQEEAGGEVVATANDQHGVRFDERGKRCMRERRAGVVDHHHSEIFARKAADRLTVTLEHELAVARRQMDGRGGDFDGALDHSGAFRGRAEGRLRADRQ